MKDIGEDWIITVQDSNEYDCEIYRFRGTEQDVKKKLVAFVLAAKNNAKEAFEYGTENVEDVYEYDDKLSTHASFTEYSLDYIAKRWCDVDFI